MEKQHIAGIYSTPLLQLLSQAHNVHAENFPVGAVEICKLCSIKTGTCPEDCGYCSQSVHHKDAKIKNEPLMDIENILENAKKAKAEGAKRFCMGAAWRTPPSNAQFQKVLAACKEVKELGLETCMTLGMLNDEQCQDLKAAGLDYYNHNLDTSPEFYNKVITTRTYEDRLNTLASVAKAGLKTCCGGIMGLGESREDRISFLAALGNLTTPPTSIPLNQLVPMQGTPLGNNPIIDPIEFVRTVATTRILFPKSFIRLAAGRESMSDTMQTLCFFAGANSIFTGDQLLTAPNCGKSADQLLFEKLDLYPHEDKANTEA